MIIVVTYATFAVAKRTPEKNSGLYRIRTLNPRALHWYRGQGFESRTSLNFFSGVLFATAKVAYNCHDHPSFKNNTVTVKSL